MSNVTNVITSQTNFDESKCKNVDKISIAQRRKILGLIRDAWKNHGPEKPFNIYEPCIQIENEKNQCWSIAEFSLAHVMKGHLSRHNKNHDDKKQDEQNDSEDEEIDE